MVSFVAEPLFSVGSFPVTNSLLTTFIADALLIYGAVYLKNHIQTIPGIFQNTMELVIDSFYSLSRSLSPRHAKQIFPWFMSFFLFIILNNWLGLLPGFGTIGFYKGKELIPFFRGADSDINTTLGLALVSVSATHILSIRNLGIKEYLSRYFSINPILLFVGLLEIISQLTSIVSLSFRLFGNIFAGEVVMQTISNLFAILVPLPFLFLEIIVGLVQALVFAMLTMASMAILTTPHHEGGE